MSVHISRQIIRLPTDIQFIILELIGYHKLRNGKYITQLDKNEEIFNKLLNIPLVIASSIMLPIRTSWLRQSWCDKIIKIETHTLDEEIEIYYEYNQYYVRYYSVSWYEYDYDDSIHPIMNEASFMLDY
jgi:hypothetical protein